MKPLQASIKMRFELIALLLLSFSLATVPKKRKNTDVPRTVTRKRSRTIKSNIKMAIANGDVEKFDRCYKVNASGVPAIQIGHDELRRWLIEVIRAGDSMMLQRMLTKRPIRDCLSYNLIYFAFTNSSIPEILHTLVSIPYELDLETPWWTKHGSNFGFLKAVVEAEENLTMAQFKQYLLYSVSSADLQDVCSTVKNPKLGNMTLKKYLETQDSPEIDHNTFQILSHAGFYMFSPRIQTFYYYWNAKSRGLSSEISKFKRSADVFQDLYDLFIYVNDGDGIAIRNHFSTVREQHISQYFIAIAIIVQKGKFDLLSHIPKLDIKTCHRINYDAILESAALNGHLETVLEFFENNIKSITPHYLTARFEQKIADAALYAELGKLLKLSEQCEGKVTLTSSQKVLVNLARAALRGDFRTILVFMEMNPQKIMHSQAAWKILLDPAAENFLHFIIHLKYNRSQ